jgi:BolA protein
MGAVADSLARKLTETFAPSRLEVIDDSHRHAGHAGARPGGESHFQVVIEAAVFEGLSRIERQRRIHAALADDLAGAVHALSVKALAPGEGG